LRTWAKKVSAEDIAKALGRHVGLVKKEGQRVRPDPIQKGEGKSKMNLGTENRRPEFVR
jgi:IS30 family transposase